MYYKGNKKKEDLHGHCLPGGMIKSVIEEARLWGKKPLDRQRQRWEACVKKDVKAVDPITDWREAAEDREKGFYITIVLYVYNLELNVYTIRYICIYKIYTVETRLTVTVGARTMMVHQMDS